MQRSSMTGPARSSPSDGRDARRKGNNSRFALSKLLGSIATISARQWIDMGVLAGALMLVAIGALLMLPMGEGVVLIWPATAIAVAALTRRPIGRWPLPVAVIGASLFAASQIMGVPVIVAICYVANDVAVILLVAWLLRRVDLDPRTLRGYGSVILVSLIGAGVSTLLAMPITFAFKDSASIADAPRWFASSAMGLIVLLPALKATRRTLTEELRLLSPALVLPVGISALATTAVFMTGSNPSLFLLVPCGVFAALSYRFIGAAMSAVVIAVIAVVFTMNASGPIALAFTSVGDRILFLQIFIATMTLTAFPVAALLYEQARANREIRDNERQLRMLTDYSTDLIVRIGRDGIRRYASPASERLLGYKPEELIGISPYGQIHPDDRNRVRRLTYALEPGGDSTVFRYRMLHRDGHYVWLEGAFRLVGDSRHNVEVVGSIRDISQRRVAESKAIEAATQLEERQRLLVMAESAARLGHWRLNLIDGRNLWSQEIFRIHGLPPGQEPELEAAIDLYHPDDRAMVREQIDRAIATGGSFAFEARLVRPDGTIRWVASRGQAERGQGAGIVGLFGVLQDTTEQVAAMADLRAAREDAERALAAKATFTATISHEIRTPLTSILAAAQLLRDTPDRAERMQHLDLLEQAGRTLSDIVDDVLTFSKLEGGHGDPEAIPFAPRNLLGTVADLFALQARRHDIALDFDAPEGVVIGDPARLQRVLTNLVGNAVKFTRAGSIRITATCDQGDCWRFEVADTGVGIRDDRIDAIFEPFVQADASTTRGYGGTGLGLSISRLLVESMGGRIGVVSRPGEGSRFWFDVHLPAVEAGTAAASAAVLSGTRATDAASSAATVLVAEDNDTNRYLISELLRRLGHRVVAVENGARAVEYVTAAAGNPVDIVLMDVQMPVMDGIAATRAIRAWNGAGAGVPIYALTADQSAERRATVAEAGMNGMLTKPVQLPLLRALLNGIVPFADTPSEAPSSVVAAIDPDRVRALGTALGTAQRDTLLALLIEDAERVPARLRTLVAADSLDLARREAHALRGAAASMGAADLIAALRVIEDASDGADIGTEALDEIDRCAQAVIASARRAMLEPA
ncbi:hypothetical protein DMC47_15350 [Nostoc sp. 3335mG]|nr:hypothetical protein DMC47_15350 [Nostoc sp. 3335mG]